MAVITDVLTKLLELTKDNKIGWQTTSDEEAFAAIIGDLSAVILQDHWGDPTLKILNKAGVDIEQLYANENTNVELRFDLGELYIMAKRVALGVDSQLDELLSELDKKAQSSG